MDRIAIKERSKQLLKKNHWVCVGVAFLATLTLGAFAGGGTSFNFSYNQSTDIPSNANPFTDVEPALVIAAILFALVGLAVSYVSQVFLTNQLMVGSCRFFLKYRRNNPVDTGELFQSYKDKTFLNIAKVTFLRDLFIGLWTLLFIVPGIIKTYEYWAVDYILAAKPDTPYEKALDLSKKMMDGHKMEVFELGLSFIGWYLLSIFTCGILAVCYVNPYYRIAMTELYSEIREDAVKRGIVSPYDVPDYMDYQPQSPYYPYYNLNAQYSPNPAQPVNSYYQQPIYTQPVNGGYYQAEPHPLPFAYGQVNYNQPQHAFAQVPTQYNVQPETPVHTAPQPITETQATPDTVVAQQEPVTPESPDTPKEPHSPDSI